MCLTRRCRLAVRTLTLSATVIHQVSSRSLRQKILHGQYSRGFGGTGISRSNCLKGSVDCPSKDTGTGVAGKGLCISAMMTFKENNAS